MLVSSLVHCIAVLFFQLWGVQTLSSIPACPASCLCEETLLVNCASLDLPTAPSHIPATTTALDLSHNALHTLAPLGAGHMLLPGLRHLRVGNNSLESLSMCSGSQGIVGTLTRRKQRCVSWAPDLQSLSADRNKLKCLPRGENFTHSQTGTPRIFQKPYPKICATLATVMSFPISKHGIKYDETSFYRKIISDRWGGVTQCD